MTLPPIDIVFFLIVIVFAIAGAINGFVNEAFGKAAPVVSIWGAVLFYRNLVGPIEKYIKVHLVSVALAFLLIFIIVFIVMKIVQILIRNIFGGEILKSLDRFLGFVFGIVEGAAIVALVLIVMKEQPWFNTDSLLEGSLFNEVLSPIISIPFSSGGAPAAVPDAGASAEISAPPSVD